MIKSKRQFPDLPHFASLIEWKLPTLFRTRAKIARAITIDDLAKIAKRKVPKVVFDYVEGSALDEVSYSRSRQVFNQVEFTAHTLRDVSKIDPTIEIFGKKVDLPILFSPTGYTRFMHHVGEPAVAAVAQENNMIYSLSTMGTTSPSELAQQVPDVRRWFQLYVMQNREDSMSVIKQAKEERQQKEQELQDKLASGEITKEEFKEQMDFARTDERFRIHELLEEGRPEEIMQEAKDFAARGTFNHQPNGLLGMLSTYMNSAKREAPFLNFVVPFVNVISNVANETLNYTPVGFVRGVREGGTITGLKPQRDWDAQKRTDLMIKATMGTALMATVYLLTKLNDDDDEPILEITTNGFGDYKKNKELAETGWQQYSLRIKNPVTGKYSSWIS